MAIYDDIRAAFEVELSNISGIPQIAYENPTSRRPAVRGINPQKRYEGFFRVSCYVAEGNGPAAADDLANLIITTFDATTDISYTNSSSETIIVSVDYAERNEGRAVDNWYEVVVDIGWYIYSQ